ncbi:protein O-mannosyl-transferase family [Haliangium ochraceum]|uniref:Glycosyltransferase RgtA/B/C/D-like domain-containing protein n=1 Tax=Haliangium ochraceum (strain DSM 14365 / JCM 11303 / SMP-2) TaxID=502025 RepID=D0LJC6_HALO1|nr:DUF2723 domain-containing protein [Haliangium ochraceum]ACY14973.1 hypothetical protein Hoch_2436 [Haliangium ochraceum DSM 14365]
MDAARTWLPRGLATAAFALYALLAPPGFYWLEAAERTTAAVALGTAPTPGAPLYAILGKAATLLPIGSLGFRLTLLGALCAALAVLWSARLTCDACRNDVHGLVGAAITGLLLALSLSLVRHATAASVFAPCAALLAGGLYLFDQLTRSGDARGGLALAGLAGLALGLHPDAWLLIPPLLVLAGARLRRGARWPLLVPVVAITIGGALLVYLPLRQAANTDPERQRPAPSALRAQLALAGDAPAPADTGERADAADSDAGTDTDDAGDADPQDSALGVLLEDSADDLGPLWFLPVFAGLLWLSRQRRNRWLAVTLGALGCAAVVLALLHGPDPGDGRYASAPLSVIVAICAGVGIAWLSRALGRGGPFVGGFAALVLVLPPALVSLPSAAVSAAPEGRRELPRALGELALWPVPPRGVVRVYDPGSAASLRYLREIEAPRPDLSAPLLPAARPPSALELARTAMSLQALFARADASDRRTRQIHADALLGLARAALALDDEALARDLAERAAATRP